MQLLADAGLNSYRFGIEWARIEPEPGLISRAELAHYRRMIDTANELGLTPFVTLHHFTNPRWFAEQGGWTAPGAIDRFRAYVETATTILDGVEWVATMNEPNMLAMMTGMAVFMQQAQKHGEDWQSPTVDTDGPRPTLPAPKPEIGRIFVEAHHAVRDIVRDRTGAEVGWTVANRAFETRPGGEEKRRELEYIWEDLYLEGSRGDDFVGVQSYSAQWVNEEGIEPHPPHPDNTLVGTRLPSGRPRDRGAAHSRGHRRRADRRHRERHRHARRHTPYRLHGRSPPPPRPWRSRTASMCAATCTGRCSTTTSGATGSRPSA